MTAERAFFVLWLAVRCIGTVLVVVGALYVARGLVGVLRDALTDARHRL